MIVVFTHVVKEILNTEEWWNYCSVDSYSFGSGESFTDTDPPGSIQLLRSNLSLCDSLSGLPFVQILQLRWVR